MDPTGDYITPHAVYRTGGDSRLKQVADEALGPVFAEFIISRIEANTAD